MPSSIPRGAARGSKGRSRALGILPEGGREGGGGGGGGNCDPSYPDLCIPAYPPDLDCGEISHTNDLSYTTDHDPYLLTHLRFWWDRKMSVVIHVSLVSV
jgi:hypothetical protein